MHSLKSNYDLKLESLTYIEWANTAGCNEVNGEKERWRGGDIVLVVVTLTFDPSILEL